MTLARHLLQGQPTCCQSPVPFLWPGVRGLAVRRMLWQGLAPLGHRALDAHLQLAGVLLVLREAAGGEGGPPWEDASPPWCPPPPLHLEGLPWSRQLRPACGSEPGVPRPISAHKGAGDHHREPPRPEPEEGWRGAQPSGAVGGGSRACPAHGVQAHVCACVHTSPHLAKLCGRQSRAYTGRGTLGRPATLLVPPMVTLENETKAPTSG